LNKVVILCDPQLRHIAPNEHIENYAGLRNTFYQDGYPSVQSVPPPHLAKQSIIYAQHSMLRDLRYYLTNSSDMVSEHEWGHFTAPSTFVFKIVAAHQIQVADYFKVMLPSLELRLTTDWFGERRQYIFLEMIRSLLDDYRDDVKLNIMCLSRPLGLSPDDDNKDNDILQWVRQKSCLDFEHCYLRLDILHERSQKLLESCKGLALIAGNRQNLDEAKAVKRKNLLVFLLLPSLLISRVYGMQPEFLPGNDKFWVFCLTTAALTGFALLTSLALGYHRKNMVSIRLTGDL
jgi:hypothetical protein